jgi:hypothetical protein
MIDHTVVKSYTAVALELHRAILGFTGLQEGTIQSICIPVGAILTATASIDYASRRASMVWDGRCVEVFVVDFAACATQIELPCTGQVAAAEQPVARKQSLPETNFRSKPTRMILAA